MNNDIPCIALFAPINNDGELLLIKRNKHPRKNYYSFVGGHSHESELLINALEREVKEELNCHLKISTDYYIRAIGNDNSSTSDDFFMSLSNLDSMNIKGMKIDRPKVNKMEIAVSNNNTTTYNLFIGKLIGTPSTSGEVKSYSSRKISSWIDAVKNREIKIQPIDFLLLQLLEYDRK